MTNQTLQNKRSLTTSKKLHDMSGKYPTKKQLNRMIKWHEQSLSFMPENDAMYGRMSRLVQALRDRLETYDQFKVNPYTTHTVLPKFNSDKELGLGEYDIGKSDYIE